MKLKWIIPLLIIACAACASAFADAWNGSVAAASHCDVLMKSISIAHGVLTLNTGALRLLTICAALMAAS